MRIERHSWDLSPQEAAALQRELAARVRIVPPRWGDSTEGLIVAAADVSARRGSRRALAAVVAVKLPGLELLELSTAERELSFPYVPGFLSFREAPAILDAFERITVHVDALICDGHGLAHPRRFGLACHVGVLLDLPTVGCAKSRLCGEYKEPGPERGDSSPLELDGQEVGRVLRTRRGARPLYVSVGHMMDTASACALVLACTRNYRLPEPCRMAHRAASGRSARG